MATIRRTGCERTRSAGFEPTAQPLIEQTRARSHRAGSQPALLRPDLPLALPSPVDIDEGPGSRLPGAIAERSFGRTCCCRGTSALRKPASRKPRRVAVEAIASTVDFYSWNLSNRYRPPQTSHLTPNRMASFELMNLLRPTFLPSRSSRRSAYSARGLTPFNVVIVLNQPQGFRSILAEFAKNGGHVVERLKASPIATRSIEGCTNSAAAARESSVWHGLRSRLSL